MSGVINNYLYNDYTENNIKFVIHEKYLHFFFFFKKQADTKFKGIIKNRSFISTRFDLHSQNPLISFSNLNKKKTCTSNFFNA
uniref:Uncharacterized protein n=1 Tax=Pertusaria plittiana TaxID=394545 RepID=A0A2P1M535_9LECA|nr:hypothetical protein [Pertusaria plittiana]